MRCHTQLIISDDSSTERWKTSLCYTVTDVQRLKLWFVLDSPPVTCKLLPFWLFLSLLTFLTLSHRSFFNLPIPMTHTLCVTHRHSNYTIFAAVCLRYIISIEPSSPCTLVPESYISYPLFLFARVLLYRIFVQFLIRSAPFVVYFSVCKVSHDFVLYFSTTSVSYDLKLILVNQDFIRNTLLSW